MHVSYNRIRERGNHLPGDGMKRTASKPKGNCFLPRISTVVLFHFDQRADRTRSSGQRQHSSGCEPTEGPLPPIWSFFGHDEPNYTYAPNGKKLLGELSALSPVPVHIRTHNLFTSGDGSYSLKWGSTNVYSEDANGKPVYDWKIVDRIFDTYHELGIKPLVELGFMPEALSTHPEPYRHNFPNGSIYTGWAYPPKDYQKWGDLVFHFVQHLRERYGDAEAKSWLWEVWNEPDISYWKGTRDEYFKLYDYASDAVLRELPGAVIGGPTAQGRWVKERQDFCAHFLNTARTSGTMPPARREHRWISSASIPKARRWWKTDTYAWESVTSWRRSRTDLRCGLISRVEEDADYPGRIRSGRLRRMLRQQPSRKCLSQRTALRSLYHRGFEADLRARRAESCNCGRCGDLGI